MIAEQLMNGKTVSYRAKGNSMTPIIKSGQKVTLKPVKLEDLKKGDIVYCKVKGRYFTHLVTAIKINKVQISNNHNYVNGWTSKVFGILDKIEKG